MRTISTFLITQAASARASKKLPDSLLGYYPRPGSVRVDGTTHRYLHLRNNVATGGKSPFHCEPEFSLLFHQRMHITTACIFLVDPVHVAIPGEALRNDSPASILDEDACVRDTAEELHDVCFVCHPSGRRLVPELVGAGIERNCKIGMVARLQTAPSVLECAQRYRVCVNKACSQWSDDQGCLIPTIPRQEDERRREAAINLISLDLQSLHTRHLYLI